MSGVQEVPMKMQVVRRGEIVETRRRRLANPSYEVVAKVAGEFVRGTHRLQYVDEDGDVVTMSSQEEWEECVACWDGAKPLRLRVDLCSGARRRASRSSSGGSGSGCARRRRRRGSQPRRSPSPEHGRRFGAPFPFGPRFPLMPFPFAFARRCPAAARGGADEPEIGEKCNNCDFQTTGRVAGFCCRKCSRGESHGRRCERKPLVAAEAEEKMENECPEQRDTRAQYPFLLMRGCPVGMAGKGCKGMGHPGMKGMFAGCGKGWEGMHCAGGKGFKGMFGGCGKGRAEAVDAELIGQKCSNCDFETTGIVDSFCCRACRYGKGHGKRCAQKVQSVNEQPVDVDPKDAQDEEQIAADVADEGTPKSDETSPAEATEQSRAGMRWGSRGLLRAGRRRSASVDAARQKCKNCDFQTTGTAGLFCCKGCRDGKDHGKRCRQLPTAGDDVPEAPVVKTSAATVESVDASPVELDELDIPSCDEESAEEQQL
ncbi:hypothetical protein DIPPA_32791 [Diplonema papillatum]|nr:hypothetical protein DIPPA_32791 [Diplonema papillatum]